MVPRLEKDLALLMDFLEKNEEIRRFIHDPFIRTEGKRAAVEKLLAGRIHAILLYFLLILLEQQKISDLKLIVDAFFEKVSRSIEKVAGELVTAKPLSRQKIAAVEREAGLLLGKEVHLRVRVDTDILGGLFVQVGDFVLDGTMDRLLEDIRQNLVGRERRKMSKKRLYYEGKQS